MTPSTRTTNRYTAHLLLVVLTLAFAMLIRVYNINRESFWADEGWTMLLSKGPTLSDIVVTMANDQHPPLYFALIHYWIDLTGNSETAIRLLSTFASVIGVALVYRLGADLFGREVGLLAALILALTDNDVMLAQEARHYAQMAMFAVASTLFYLRYVRHPSRTNGIGWLLASIALMYTHYLGGFVIIVQAIHALLFVRPLRRLLDIGFRDLMICVAWLPWAYVFIGQSMWRYQRPIIFQSSLPNSPATYSLVRGDLIGYQWGITGGLLMLGLIYIMYRQGKASFSLRPLLPTIYLALWVAIPIISIVAINARFPILTTRNFLIVTPGIAVLIAHGLMNLDVTARRFATIALVCVSLFNVDAYFLKPPWRQVAQDVLQYRHADEPILMDIWVDEFALQYHFGRDLNAPPEQLPLVGLTTWRENYHGEFFPRLLTYLSDKDSFWLVYWGQNKDGLLDFFPQHGFTRTATQLEMHLTEQIFVYRYDRVPEQPQTTYGDQLALMKTQTDVTGDQLRVNLLWKALQKPAVDYSVSVFVLDSNGTLVQQDDSSPLKNTDPTSGWAQDSVHFDSHTLMLPTPSADGEYTIGVKVYWYADPKPLAVTGDNAEYFIMGKLQYACEQYGDIVKCGWQ
jgi:uncharacterized membrane protein